ncbi:MAG TPA: molybdenum ABC transporter ATP-binding protein [Thermoanaerobaculia bacterium]|nr:molybdenum ABC transporter ATP-binding protein [Thermoanaerobaculia bacterium]
MIRLDLEQPTSSFLLRVRADLAGRVTAIVGPSGAGKTSLLEAIAGLRSETRGRIEVDGVAFLSAAEGIRLPPERRRVGYVPQDGALFPHLSARRNIEFAGPDPERMRHLRDVLDLDPLLDRHPRKLSGGERQRVAIARALMMRPRLLLLDEPLAAIDQTRKERIVSFLARLRREIDVPMVYVTHLPLEALALADEALVLDAGRVVAHGPAQALLHRRDLGGAAVAENVLELDHPRFDRERGVVRAETPEGMLLSIPLETADGARWPLLVRVSGDDVVVFTAPPGPLSARNVLEGPLVELELFDGSADLLVGTPTPLRVRLTRDAALDLALRPGMPLWLALRTRSIRPFAG